MSKNHVDFHCLNCVYSLALKNKSELHKKVCENKDFYNGKIPSKVFKILEFNQ